VAADKRHCIVRKYHLFNLHYGSSMAAAQFTLLLYFIFGIFALAHIFLSLASTLICLFVDSLVVVA
jgi:hypothetical protein